MTFSETPDSQLAEEVGQAIVAPQEPLVKIRPATRMPSINLGELWGYRELCYFFIWRDIKVRYKQTALGVIWAILEPFVTMVVFSIFFGRLAGIPSEGIPYPIWSYTALVPWALFSNGVNKSSNSLVGGANLIKKVYFPRLVLPTSAVLAGLADFFFAFIVLLLLMVYFRIAPTVYVIWLPAFLLLATSASLSVGVCFSALNVHYRDVRFVVPMMLRVWLFVTPIVYPSSLLGEPWQTLSGLNPMTGVVEGFRWALLGTDPPSSMLALSVIVTLILFISGLLFFRRMEDSFADIV
jgi:lipopolysaccharide transport system permease protein